MSNQFTNFKQVGQGLFGINSYAGNGADSEFGGLVSSIDVSWSSDKAELKKKGNVVGKCYFNSNASLTFEVYTLGTDTNIPRIGDVYNLTATIPNLTIKGSNTEQGDANITKCVIENVSIKMQSEAYVTFSVTASYCEGMTDLHSVVEG